MEIPPNRRVDNPVTGSCIVRVEVVRKRNCLLLFHEHDFAYSHCISENTGDGCGLVRGRNSAVVGAELIPWRALESNNKVRRKHVGRHIVNGCVQIE
jgi:hypothetical protein